MWRIVLLGHLLATGGSLVLFEGLPPPTDVHVGDSLLVWSAPPTHPDATTYTVQYIPNISSKGWQNVPSCVRSQNTSCDVNATMKNDGFGCVRLHVHAHKHSLTSDSVEACSQQETACSPKVQLSAQPGTLTVHLIGDHPLIHKHGRGQIQHLVSYGKEGEPLQALVPSLSSAVITGLDEGQRYCVAVVFTYFNTRIAPPSCAKCIDIPQSDERTEITLGLVLGFGAVVLLLVLPVAYVILFQIEKIKAWMRPPYTMPQCIMEPFDTRPHPTLVFSEDHISPVEALHLSTSTLPLHSSSSSLMEHFGRGSNTC